MATFHYDIETRKGKGKGKGYAGGVLARVETLEAERVSDGERWGDWSGAAQLLAGRAGRGKGRS